MNLDIKEFARRLEEEKAKGKTETEIANFIHKEIRLAETMKAGLMDEMDEKTADFLKDAAVRFDNYLFQLQEIEKGIRLNNLSLDQQIALTDTAVRDQIAEQMETLHKIDPKKHEQKDNTDPPENLPENSSEN